MTSDTTPKAGPTTTLLERAGGEAGLRRMVEVFYANVLADPVLHPLFGHGRASHVEHLTTFFAEVFGGPTRYTGQLGGFPALLDAHRGLRISEDQRQRFIQLLINAAEDLGMLDDASFREAFIGYAYFGTHVAKQNSWATTDDELHECQEVPHWQG